MPHIQFYAAPSKIHNPNCDGDHCPSERGEVRKYPLGGGANAILCQGCWARENIYRYQRGRETKRPDLWPQENWYTAKVYPQE